MSTFLLVHGAWHDGRCWKRVVPLLESAGHRVRPVPAIQPNGSPARVWELPTGHDCMITMPTELSELLLKLDLWQRPAVEQRARQLFLSTAAAGRSRLSERTTCRVPGSAQTAGPSIQSTGSRLTSPVTTLLRPMNSGPRRGHNKQDDRESRTRE